MVKIVLLGYKNSGKSAFARRIVFKDFRTVKYVRGETQPEDYEVYQKKTRLQSGVVVDAFLLDCSWDVFRHASEEDLRARLIKDADAVLYFLSDSDVGNIDQLEVCLEKAHPIVRNVARQQCVTFLVLNSMLHRNKELFLSTIQRRATELRASYAVVDIGQNARVEELMADVLFMTHYIEILPRVTLLRAPQQVSKTTEPAATSLPNDRQLPNDTAPVRYCLLWWLCCGCCPSLLYSPSSSSLENTDEDDGDEDIAK